MTKREAGLLSDADEARVQAMIARDPDAPDVTPEEAAQARPASEALDPALFAALTRRGRPKSENAKKLVTLRLPPEVIEGYQAGGPGWQVRMGEVLAAGITPVSMGDPKARSGRIIARISRKNAEIVPHAIVGRSTKSGQYSLVRSRSAAAGKPRSKPEPA